MTFTRRNALKLGLAAAATPWFVPARALARGSANDALRIGVIGTGRMGRGDMFSILDRGLDASLNARIVAVCDVDRRRVELAQRDVRQQYASKAPDAAAPAVDTYGDFRELLARDDIDGVIISTPDFWHAPVAVAAAKAGKDIYIQKPITYSINEGKALVAAVRGHEVILQTGSQQRSDGRFRKACELVRNGRLGPLRRIFVHLPPDSGTGDATTMPVPENLDYDMWLGPTPDVPYTEHRVHPQKDFSRPGWLQIDGYCRGMITGWGSHMNDIAQWGHGGDADSGPVMIEAQAEFPERGLFDVHTKYEAHGRYADGVELMQETGNPAGVRFEGDDGWIFVRRGGIEASAPEILGDPLGSDALRLPVSGDHYRNFLESMRSRQDPICPVEVGHRSNTVCVITHIAMKLGRRLQWDPVAERFRDDDTANAMLDHEHRSPWSVS